MGGLSKGVRELKETEEVWRVEMMCEDEVLEVRIRKGLFQGYALPHLLFVISIIPLTSNFRKASPGYNFASNKANINHLLYMNDLKPYGIKQKGLESLIQTEVSART